MDANGWSSAADLGIGVSKSFGDISGSLLYTNGEGYWNSSSDNNEKISVQAMYGEGDLSANEGFNVGGVFSTLNNTTTTTGCDTGCNMACGAACDCGSGTCTCADMGGAACGCGTGSTCGVPQTSTSTSDVAASVMGVFGGFSGFGARVGFEYNMGTDLGLAGYGSSSSLMSFYANYGLSFVEGLSVMLKYDISDPDADVEKNETTTMLAGLIYQCADGFTVSPNMLQTTVGEADPTTAMNLTFQFQF